MPRTSAFLAALLVGTLLSGCSEGAPSGDLVTGTPSADVGGDSTAVVTVRAKIDPINDQSPPVPVPGNVACAAGGVPNAPNEVKCVDPRTDVNVTFTFPAADGEGYVLFGVDSNGTATKLGALEAGAVTDATGPVTYYLNHTKPEDLSTAYVLLQVRHGESDTVLASAPYATGSNGFTADPTLAAVSATGSYDGDELTVVVSNLPNGTWTGYLYAPDETGALVQQKSFPGIHNGENVLTADSDIADYAEFHIHLGTSKVNVYKATIE